MKHFRWITPLLLAFSVFMLSQIWSDFKELQKKLDALNITVEKMKTSITGTIE